MKILFKKYFIPHEGNDHRPHLLRWETALVLLSAVLGIELLFLGHFLLIRNTNFLAEIVSNVLVDQTNVEREELSLNDLKINPILQAAALLKAQDMAEKGYFAHTTPDGKTPWYWLEQVGYTFAAAGENLAVNFLDSEDVTEAWMNSPKHRENILNGGFTEIGIATARGTYKGKTTTFVVQFFGRPMVKAAGAETESVFLPVAPAPQPLEETITEEDLAIEVQGASEPVPAAEEGTMSLRVTNPIEQVATQPKLIYNLLLATLATIVTLALVLTVFIAMRIQHPPLIVNGIFLLLVVASAIVLNQYLSFAGASVV